MLGRWNYNKKLCITQMKYLGIIIISSILLILLIKISFYTFYIFKNKLRIQPIKFDKIKILLGCIGFSLIGLKLYQDSLKSDVLKKDLIENKTFSICKITSVKHYYKSDELFTFQYIINQKQYTGEYKSSKFSTAIYDEIKGKFLPIVYSRIDPKNCRLLLSRDDFERFNLPYPDSLLWIYNYEKRYRMLIKKEDVAFF